MRSLIGLMIVTVAACGGGGTSMEGVYTIDAWNMNPTSCADPGPSVLASHTETALFIKNDSLLGHSFVNVVVTDDEAMAAMQLADDSTVHLGNQFGIFENGSDGNGWTEVDAFAFEDFTDPTMCSGDANTSLLAQDGDTAAAVRIEHTALPLFPKNGGMCNDDDAKALAATLPCTDVETAHATRAAGF